MAKKGAKRYPKRYKKGTKIKKVPHENQINSIGYKNTVAKLVDGYHIAIDYPESYQYFQEYPCQITYIKNLK